MVLRLSARPDKVSTTLAIADPRNDRRVTAHSVMQVGTSWGGGRRAAVALGVLVATAGACGSSSSNAGDSAAPTVATFDRSAPYRFTTMATEGQVDGKSVDYHHFRTDGIAAPSGQTASQTGVDLSGSIKPGVYLYAAGTDYQSVALAGESLPPNVVQRRMLAGKHWVAVGPTGSPGADTFSVAALVDQSPFTGAFDLLAGLRAADFAVAPHGIATVRGVAQRTTIVPPAAFPTATTATRVRRLQPSTCGSTAPGEHGGCSSAPTIRPRVTRCRRSTSSPRSTTTSAPRTRLSAPRCRRRGQRSRALSQALACQPTPTDPPKTTPDCR